MARPAKPAIFSLHIGKSAELCASPVPPKLSRDVSIGDIRTHIRVPGGVFAVTIRSEGLARSGDTVYAAVNAGPMEVNGMVCVRWKPPKPGTYVATLWKQREKVHTKPADIDAFVKTCTKVAPFLFDIV